MKCEKLNNRNANDESLTYRNKFQFGSKFL